ncbi:uncharacterized protein V6R79_016048 [Siganus canaliculatus]
MRQSDGLTDRLDVQLFKHRQKTRKQISKAVSHINAVGKRFQRTCMATIDKARVNSNNAVVIRGMVDKV